MEKKTIGGFMSALRKAHGMTQKELAERLNVSDKTVSRWERDDGAPELSLIPVIAEIFEVTCDELLRGQRQSPALRAENDGETDPSPKAEKQRQWLLKSTLSQYKGQTYLAMGVSVAGLMAALVCNLAFLKAVLGFFLGAVFFTASIVYQAILVNRAFFRVEDAGVDTGVLSHYRRSVIALAQRSIGLTVALTGFTLPLLMVDAYVGLRAGSLLLLGTVSAAVFLLIYAVVLYFLNASLVKRGVYALSEKAAAIYHHNHRMKRICAIVLLLLLAVTAVAHTFATSIWGPYTIMRGTTFHDYDSFIAYMEQDIPADSSALDSPNTQIGESIYVDEYGNEVTPSEAHTVRLEDKNGVIVCEFVQRNRRAHLRYTPKDGTILPITVFTDDDLQEAQQTVAVRHVLFSAAYAVECLAVVLVYNKRRAK